MKKQKHTYLIILTAALAVAAGLWIRAGFRRESPRNPASRLQARAEQNEQELLQDAQRAAAAAAARPRAPIQTSTARLAAPAPQAAEQGPGATAAPKPDSPLEQVLGDGDITYDQRRKELCRHMQHSLTPRRKSTIESFIRLTSPPKGISQIEMDSLKSDALYALCTQTTDPAQTTQLLQDILSDHRQGDVMHDFAVQYLRTWHEQAPPAEKQKIEQILWDIARHSENGELVATAVMNLDDLRSIGELEQAETDQLTGLALERLRDESPSVKAVTLQALAPAQHPEAVQAAVDLLTGDTRHSSTAVRLAAIHLLGQVQDGSASEMLETISQDGDKYEQAAALEALKQNPNL